MGNYIVHEEGAGNTPQHPRRRLGWKTLCALSIIIFLLSIVGLAFAIGPMDDPLRSVAPGSSAEQSAQPALTDARVAALLESLEWGGKKIGVEPGSADIVVAGSDVWVTTHETGAASDTVGLTSQRIFALAKLLREEGIAESVTWHVEDKDGALQFAGTLAATAAVPEDGSADTEKLLSALTGYSMAPAYAQEAGVSQRTAGTVATGPEGTESIFSDEPQTPAAPAQDTQAAPSAGSGTPSSGSDSSLAPPVTETEDDHERGSLGDAPAISVSVTVDASLAGRGKNTISVSVPANYTVLDALYAAGFVPDVRSTQYGLYVQGINGLEASSRKRRGWVYAVNGFEPDCSAASCPLVADDSIVWTYVSY